MKNKFLIALACLTALTACGEKPHVVPQQVAAPAAPVVQAAGQPAAAPVVVQQSSSGESSLMPALLGGAVGYMLGSSGRQTQPVAPAQTHTRTIIRERVVERPAQAAQQPKPAAVAPQLTQRTFQTSRTASPAPTGSRSFTSSRPSSSSRR